MKPSFQAEGKTLQRSHPLKRVFLTSIKMTPGGFIIFHSSQRVYHIMIGDGMVILPIAHITGVS